MMGKGQARIDDMQIETVDNNVASTNMLTPQDMQKENPNNVKKATQTKPVNLDFEGGIV